MTEFRVFLKLNDNPDPVSMQCQAETPQQAGIDVRKIFKFGNERVVITKIKCIDK